MMNHSSIPWCGHAEILSCNGFIRELLKAWDLVPEGIGLTQQKELGEKCIGELLPGGHNFLVGVVHCFAFPNNENGKRQRCTTSWVIPQMMNVMQISRKCWRWALASYDAFLQNGLCCTILMMAGLSSMLPSPTFISGAVPILALDGAEKLLMHFQAAISTGSSCGVDP
jgi:hypothetical protein